MADWFTFVPLLKEVLETYHPKKIIEWGTGKSTKVMDIEGVMEIHTFEHQQNWYNKYKNSYSERVKCHLIPLGKGYTVAGNMFKSNYFDLAFIDGRERVKCMMTAKELVKDGGFIMLHDSERKKYEEGVKLFTVIKEVDGTLLMRK
ncbi:hypothetical protein KAX02_00010 [candidate division WOR-3 bacterium]|nr:hypothetical protein [candidate division WOR-3 bacterium]